MSLESHNQPMHDRDMRTNHDTATTTTAPGTLTTHGSDTRCWWRMAVGPGYAVGPSGRLVDYVGSRPGRC